MRGIGFSKRTLLPLALVSSLFWMTSLSGCAARSAEEREIRRVWFEPGADLNAEFFAQTGKKTPPWKGLILPLEDYQKR